MAFLLATATESRDRVCRYINHEAGEISRKDLANLIRQRRKTGNDLPPIYPNGWFRLIDSVQLGLEEVKQVHAIGQCEQVNKLFYSEYYRLFA